MSKHSTYTALLLLVLILAGCGDTPATTAPVNAPPTTTNPGPERATETTSAPATSTTAPPPATSTTVQVQPTDTSPPPAASFNDSAVIDLLKAVGLPIGEVVVYTAETDPNKLLGRPNQYIAKASWHDTRLPAPKNPNEPEVSDGGGIELYADAAGAQARMEYIQNIGKKLPLAVEYDFVKGPLLLRVTKELTPAQADEYKQALDIIPLP